MIFVLRHVDRSSASTDALSPAGLKRARFLAHMLGDSGLSVGYCSDAARTRETLAPLRQSLGDALTVHEISTGAPGGPVAHVRGVIEAVNALPADAVAIAVSHSNTVGEIIEGLGGGSIDPIREDEFDRLFLLIGPAGAGKTLVRLRY